MSVVRRVELIILTDSEIDSMIKSDASVQTIKKFISGLRRSYKKFVLIMKVIKQTLDSLRKFLPRKGNK
jgi:hypothetical protein